jgi:hypothetical protein
VPSLHRSLRVHSFALDTIRAHTFTVLWFFLAAGVSDVCEVTREHIRAHDAALCARSVRLLALKAFFVGCLESAERDPGQSMPGLKPPSELSPGEALELVKAFSFL